ncbi:hypothetical protein RJ639_009536 [Escallonia herrerae]|uniref:Integrase catalytic domain-containing protein n=1 Tax=Escallonia herrerae TaxID=1293975 RepID=A0AA88VQA1_9ASTE|nr:hypothetical protein RJ639_009536 [Escallonia herrerae]
MKIEDLKDETKVERGKPSEDLIDIELYLGNQEKTVRVGTGLSDDLKLKLVDLLRSYSDTFAWTTSDMPRIDPEAIRKAKDFEWTEECQKSFEELKLYLSSPPLLTKPVTGEDLFLYLSISEVAVSTVLIREEEGKQRPVYYISKVLQDVGTRYPRIDKVALALVISVRKLRPYFQSHTVVVLIDQPLGKVLQIAIDYFTKWTEAEALATITASKCKEFFWKNVICHFRVPKILITDNGKQFNNSNFQSFCEGLFTGLRFTSVAHPQSNGQTENMNRSILQGLKRKLDDAKGAWVDELLKALLPIEVGRPTVQVLQFAETENEENLKGNLDLLDDVRAQALDRMISTKQRVARYYNRRVRMKIFRVGNLVLRKLEVSDPKAAVGKLWPNWEGPYKVSKVDQTNEFSPPVGHKLTWHHFIMVEEGDIKGVHWDPIARTNLTFVDTCFQVRTIIGRLLECRNPSREGRRQRNSFQKLNYAIFCHLVHLLIYGEPSVFIKIIFGFILDFPKSISTGKRSADLGSRSSYLTSMS